MGRIAANALDNDKYTLYQSDGIGNDEFWKAEIQGGKHLITYVEIQNREDSDGHRLKDITVTVDGALCGSITEHRLES